jgi:hypothetical protein
MIIVTVVM